MRQIKFRGKIRKTDMLVYGFFFINSIGESKIIETGDTPQTMSDPCGGSYIEYHSVDINTVCQFTGLTDKNGVEIYEGDVIKRIDTGSTFVVIWKNDCYVARRKYDNWLERDVEKEKKDSALHFTTTFKIEVIGNIHQNK